MIPVGPGVVATRVSFLLVLALTIQVGLAPEIPVLGVQGDLMLLIAIGGGLAAGPDRGAAVGFASGLAYDLFVQTPFGLSALTYALVAFLVGSLQDSVLRAAWWIPVATAGAGSVVGVILYFVFGTVVGVDFAGTSLPMVALVVGSLNAIAAPLLIRAVRWATGTQDSVRARSVYR
ncbi:MAG: rod shape-determining protein MreD [Acidimicrobiales bacterium]|nr:rod shape-determining protein MreD [Acidimicrobiales bacterium]